MFDLRKRQFSQRKRSKTHPERGQSLVEMAVIIPLLAFMFIGLIEVGWAIRGYLVLLTTNRETTRFAARGEYLNFEGRDMPEEEVAGRVGYNSVFTHTNNILTNNRLALDLVDDQGNPLLQPLPAASQGSFIISHYLIDTGYPCKLSDDPDDEDNYDCSEACGSGDYYTFDDLVLHPGLAGYEHFIYTRPATTTYTSRLVPADLEAFIETLKEDNNKLNCAILQRRSSANSNPEMSVNSLVVVEAFYDQPQLLGFPLLANTFTDPILLYTQTKMRITSDKLPQGAGCEVLPIVIREDTLYNDPPDNNELKAIGTPIDDIEEGSGQGNFGWLKWREGDSEDETITENTNSEGYLSEAVNNTRLSMYDFQDATDETDTNLNVDDWVWGKTGQVASNGVAQTAVVDRIDQIVTIPVWDDTDGQGQNTKYHIVAFAKMRITGIDFQGSPKTISGVFMGWDNSCFEPDEG